MNRIWLSLIIVGVIFLAVSIGWEIYEDSQGYRSEFNRVVIEYRHNVLLSPSITKKLNNDPNLTLFEQTESSQSS